MDDIIVIGMIVLILGAAAWYIISQKKKGAKCIGCPSSKTCGSQHGCNGNCSGCNGNCGNK